MSRWNEAWEAFLRVDCCPTAVRSEPTRQKGGRGFVWGHPAVQCSLRLWAAVTRYRNRPIFQEWVSFSPLTHGPRWGAGSSPLGRLASVKRQRWFSEGSRRGLGSVPDNVPTEKDTHAHLPVRCALQRRLRGWQGRTAVERLDHKTCRRARDRGGIFPSPQTQSGTQLTRRNRQKKKQKHRTHWKVWNH